MIVWKNHDNSYCMIELLENSIQRSEFAEEVRDILLKLRKIKGSMTMEELLTVYKCRKTVKGEWHGVDIKKLQKKLFYLHNYNLVKMICPLDTTIELTSPGKNEVTTKLEFLESRLRVRKLLTRDFVEEEKENHKTRLEFAKKRHNEREAEIKKLEAEIATEKNQFKRSATKY